MSQVLINQSNAIVGYLHDELTDLGRLSHEFSFGDRYGIPNILVTQKDPDEISTTILGLSSIIFEDYDKALDYLDKLPHKILSNDHYYGPNGFDGTVSNLTGEVYPSKDFCKNDKNGLSLTDIDAIYTHIINSINNL
jgi:hypothetical protein